MNTHNKTTAKIKTNLRKSPDWIPSSIRKAVRFFSGGNNHASKLIRGLLWKTRYFVFMSLMSNLLAAVLEGSTFAILTIILEMFSSSDSTSLESMGRLGIWIQTQQTDANTNQIFSILLFYVIVSQILRSGLQFVGEATTAYVTAWSEGDLRRQLFHQYMHMSYATANSYKVGDLVSYTEQSTQIGSLLMIINKLISLVFIITAYVAVMLWLSWPITIATLFALLILSLSMGRIIRNVRLLSRQFVDAAVAVNAHVVEYLSGLRVIHTFSRVDYAIKRTNKIIDEGVRARRQALIWKSSITPVMESVAIIGLAALLIIVVNVNTRVDGVISISRMGVFILVMYRLLPRITTMNGYVAGINNWMPFAERIADMLRHDDKKYVKSGKRPFSAFKYDITFEDVSLRYEKEGKTAVSNVSLTIEHGKVTALVGTSGSGKSTIINLMLRLYDPTQGQIKIDGQALNDLDITDWRNCIGVVDQDTFVFSDTIIENIRIGRLDATDDDVQFAAKVANADKFITQLPSGYDTEVGNRGFRLSGGQRQRLAIARAIIRNPSILIFVEATSALDSESEQLIQESLKILRHERAVIVIAHRLSTVTMADMIVVLDEGKIVEQGTHEELLKINGRYADLWQLQQFSAKNGSMGAA